MPGAIDRQVVDVEVAGGGGDGGRVEVEAALGLTRGNVSLI